jgi:hypothetical protein
VIKILGFRFHQASDCANCGEPYEENGEFHDLDGGYCIHGGTYEDATTYEPIGLWRLVKSWFRRRPKLDFDSITEL